MQGVTSPGKIGKKRGPKAPWKYSTEFVDSLAVKLQEFIIEKTGKEKPIFFQRFCYENNVDRTMFPVWADKNSEKYNENFFLAYTKFKEMQEADLAEGALEQRYDPGFAFRALKNVAGWRDEQYLKGEGFNQIFNIVLNELPSRRENRLIENATV